MVSQRGIRQRRQFLQTLGLGGLAAGAAASMRFFERGAFAEQLQQEQKQIKTAWVEEGPYYPPKLPLDTDNDLLVINDTITPAVGHVAHLSGRLLNEKGSPVRNATIELWQADHTGTYIAERPTAGRGDSHFQGFGRFLTSSSGEYYFRTIKPVPYTGRSAPHIHLKIKMKGRDDWTTQLFIKGYPGNAIDGVYTGVGDADARATVTREFKRIKASDAGAFAVKHDIVLGITAEDSD